MSQSSTIVLDSDSDSGDRNPPPPARSQEVIYIDGDTDTDTETEAEATVTVAKKKSLPVGPSDVIDVLKTVREKSLPVDAAAEAAKDPEPSNFVDVGGATETEEDEPSTVKREDTILSAFNLLSEEEQSQVDFSHYVSFVKANSVSDAEDNSGIADLERRQQPTQRAQPAQQAQPEPAPKRIKLDNKDTLEAAFGELE